MNTLVVAQDSPFGNPVEKEALHSLKATFKDPFLNSNWIGFPCNEAEPSRWFGIRCSTSGRVTGIILEGMGLTGKINVKAFFNLTELSILSFKNNSLKGNLMDFSNNRHLKYIDLSSNEFDGPITRSLLNLNLLETLLLQDNKLIGPLPEFNQPSLKIINVSGNNLHGKVRITQSFRSQGLRGPLSLKSRSSSLKASVPAPGGYSENEEPENQNGSSNKDNISTILIIFNVILLLAIILLAYFYYKTAKKLNNIMKQQIPINKDVMETTIDKVEMRDRQSSVVMAVEEKKELIFFTDEPKFQMNELLKASAEGLGQGIMGNSYKAMLNGGASIVVKRLRDLKPMTRDDFAKQLHEIADLKHPNLLPLLAYYNSRDERLLLYRYAEKGNLFFRLHGNRSGNRIPFTWNSRLSVAKGVARGLTYLHLNAKPNNSTSMAPHGNLKSSNVLLEENDTVLVSDYGLSPLIAQPKAAQRMVVYKSPEYGYTRKVSKQSDVWSYGSLLIELLTGRLSTCSAPPGVTGSDLWNWVHRAVREEWTAEIFDKEISGQRGALPGMLRLLQIAMRCTDRFPENRPDMREVVREVEKIEVAPWTSEDEEDVSGDRSITTDDSLYSTSTTASGIIGDDR
ncbi:hypothetical protein K1719_023127 [Acacia pycnantha]|nr:hypothetical protein K1719_023127 [Acacia pycnantha]